MNAHATIDEFPTRFDNAKFEFLRFKKVCEELDVEAVDESFKTSRDKVCEIQAYRALSRPVPTGETSKSLAQKAIQTIDALRGSLPCKLGVVLKTAAE